MEKTISDADVKAVLNFDAIDFAEKVTGISYKDSTEIALLGMSLAMSHNEQKANMLKELGDTCFSNKLDEYQAILLVEGFELVLEVPFEYEDKNVFMRSEEDGTPVYEDRHKFDSLFIYHQRELGILLSFDSYNSRTSVNGGKMYYNWSPNDCSIEAGVTSSGGCVHHGQGYHDIYFNKDLTPHPLPEAMLVREPLFGSTTYDEFCVLNEIWRKEKEAYIKEHELMMIWSGNHDCREALRFNISQLKKHGTFIPSWVQAPFLWLLHYRDTKDEEYDYKALNKERIALLPLHVQAAINYGEKN